MRLVAFDLYRYRCELRLPGRLNSTVYDYDGVLLEPDR